MKKVSIVVPIYNADKYIARCVDSLLNQDYKNIELVLINDGSYDESEKICNDYVKNNKNVKLFTQKNSGVSVARNTGVKNSTGDYICFVDSDDYVKSSFISDFVKAIEKDSSDIAICKYERVSEYIYYDSNEELSTTTISGIDGLKELLEFYPKGIITNHMWNKIFKKELFEGIEFPIGRNFEDIGVCYLLFEKANIISLMNKSNYYYYEHENSIMTNLSRKSIEDKYYVGEARNEYIEYKYPELKEKNNEYNIHNYLYLLKELIKKDGRKVKKNDLFNNIRKKYLLINLEKKLDKKEKIISFAVKANISIIYDIIKK